jgi:NAD(P)-dependent dehydrogenase (short-subunit alcohol dehydrogenase family)
LTLLIVGASGGLGRALCYRFATERRDLVIVASDDRDLKALKSDLEIRFGSRVRAVAADLSESPDYGERLRAAVAEMSPLRGLLFPIGAMAAQDDGALAGEGAERLMRANFLSVVDTVALFLPSIRPPGGGGTIVGFGSIAAARGRGANMVYSASKRALQTYFESLRHLCARTGPLVQFYVVGYLDTSLAAGRTKLFPKASPARLANRVARDLDRDIGSVHYPWFWRPVTLAVRSMPWFLYKRMQF